MGNVAIIGLASSTGPGSGKSYTASTIQGQLINSGGISTILLSFAGPVKSIAESMAQRLWGATLSGKAKSDQVVGSFRMSVRDLYRAVGDCHREACTDVWVTNMGKRIELIVEEHHRRYSNDLVILIDDVRYRNELELIVELGGKTFNLVNLEKEGISFEDSGDLVFDKHVFPINLTLYNEPGSGILGQQVLTKVLPVIQTQLEGE